MRWLNRRAGMKRLHGDHKLYWEYQRRFALEKLIPILREWGVDPAGKRVLEVGCGDGGIIHAFAEAGASCAGVELNEKRVREGRKFATFEIPVLIGDFCDSKILDRISGEWDLVLVRDVLEHLLDKDAAMRNLKTILAPKGRIFFDFPPWFMPFGGHQQALSTFLRFVPFLHYLPRPLYEKVIYRSEKDNPSVFEELMDTYDARITLHGFRRLLRQHGFALDKSRLYLFNPSYEIKFGLPEIPLGPLAGVPLLPEVLASNMYALATSKNA